MEIHYGWVVVSVSILTHAAAMIWWAATITQRLKTLEQLVTRMEVELEKGQDRTASILDKFDKVLTTFTTFKREP